MLRSIISTEIVHRYSSALKNKKGPESSHLSEGLKTWPVRDKAWHSRADLVLGDIVSRAWSKVGKEIGHTGTMEMMNNPYLWVRFGDRRHHSGTLTNLARSFWSHENRRRRPAKAKN